MFRHFFVLPSLHHLYSSNVAQANCNTTNNQPLKLWKNEKIKAAIISFVQTVTNKNDSNDVPENQRIAVFANDGIL